MDQPDELFNEHRTRLLHMRGIKDWLTNAEPARYRSFSKGDSSRYASLMDIPNPKPAQKGKVTQSGGIVIARYAPDGSGLPQYARFDEDLYFSKPPSNPKFLGQGKTHYAYRAGHRVKHIDVHPLAASRPWARGPVYFCLEGCLKADAVLGRRPSDVFHLGHYLELSRPPRASADFDSRECGVCRSRLGLLLKRTLRRPLQSDGPVSHRELQRSGWRCVTLAYR